MEIESIFFIEVRLGLDSGSLVSFLIVSIFHTPCFIWASLSQMIKIIFVLLLTLALQIAVAEKRYTIDNCPTIKDSDNVQFFFLQAPFPYNTPSSIM